MSLPPKLSVVIPVYNEEAVLPTLFGRLYPALDALGTSYEIVFINDGSCASSSRGGRSTRGWCCFMPISASTRPSWRAWPMRAVSMW